MKKMTKNEIFAHSYTMNEVYRTGMNVVNLAGGYLNKFKKEAKILDYKGSLALGVQTPNSDTQYAYAIIDLSKGPVMVHAKNFERYQSLHIFDLKHQMPMVDYLQDDGIILTLPGQEIIAKDRSKKVVVVETSILWAVLRVAPDNAKSKETMKDIQKTFKITTLEGKDAAIKCEFKQEFKNWFEQVKYVQKFVVKTDDRTEGVRDFVKTKLTADEIANIEKNGMKRIGQEPSADFNLSFGDKGYRKEDIFAIASGILIGLGGLPNRDAFYPVIETDEKGKVLEGKNVYKLTFPAPVPVKFFFSTTMYELPSRMFYDNDLNRYLVNNTNISNLNKDVHVYMSNEKPKGLKASNNEIWLPAPEGQFYLLNRFYGPKADIFSGKWKTTIKKIK